MTRTYTYALALVLCVSTAAQAQASDTKKVRFFGEQGFESFLRNEPSEMPPIEITIDDSPQKSLLNERDVTEVTFPRFAFQVAPSQHFMGISFDNDAFTRFYQSAIGTEFSIHLHILRGLDAFVSAEWSWFTGREGDIGAVRGKLDDFNMYTFLVGIRPFTDLSRLVGVRSDFLSNFMVNMRLAAGAASFEGAWRLKPEPQQWFWSPSTMGVLHAAVGIEVRILDLDPLGEFSIMAEQGLRFYSSPAEYSASRPHNEIGPFSYAVFQAGLFFRLKFS